MPRYKISRHARRRLRQRGVRKMEWVESTLDGEWYDHGDRVMVIHRNWRPSGGRGGASDLVTIFDHRHCKCITVYRDRKRRLRQRGNF